MLLSLLKYPTTRREALRVFGLNNSNGHYAGTPHQLMGEVLSRVGAIDRWQWKYHRRFVFRYVFQSIVKHLQQTPFPTLISFGAIHKNGIWRCRHTAVLVGVNQKSIDLLDPLGKPPHETLSNVRFYAGPSIDVVGNSYTVDIHSEVGILHWSMK